jgi:hypothetical protein
MQPPKGIAYLTVDDMQHLHNLHEQDFVDVEAPTARETPQRKSVRRGSVLREARDPVMRELPVRHLKHRAAVLVWNKPDWALERKRTKRLSRKKTLERKRTKDLERGKTRDLVEKMLERGRTKDLERGKTRALERGNTKTPESRETVVIIGTVPGEGQTIIGTVPAEGQTVAS